MATRTWSGAAGDGSWATAGNWDVAPVTGDDVIIATTNGTNPNIDGGLTTGIDLNSLTITPGFSGNIGSAAAPLSISVQNGGTSMFHYAGSGEYCKVTGTIKNAKIEHATGTLYAAGGTWGTSGVINFNSRVIIEAACVLAGTWNGTGGSLNVGTNATAIPLLTTLNTTVYITARDVTSSRQTGGTWTIEGDGQLAAHVIETGKTRLWNTGTNAAITNKAGHLTVVGTRAASSPVITLYTPWSLGSEVLIWNHINATPGTTTPVGPRLQLAGSAATS